MKFNFSDNNILIIGDSMLDVYHYGSSTRISPEAPVPILTIDNTEYRLGGAANVAANIKSLGGNPILLSLIGKDQSGIEFLDLLEKSQITTDYIVESNWRPTTIKTRYLNSNQHVLRIDTEVNNDLTTVEEVHITEMLYEITSQMNINCIVIQDYNKGLLKKEFIELILDIAKRKHIDIIVDPKKNNIDSYQGVQIFKPNLKEFNQISKQEGLTNLFPLAEEFVKKNSLDNIMITLSENGIFWYDGKEWGIEQIPFKLDLVDVCGAGDSVTALLSLLQNTNLSLKEKSKLCNIIGGLACTKLGTHPVLISEFNDSISS